MTLEAWDLFGRIVVAMGAAGVIEVGLAFLMRTPRETGGFDDR